jgi:hypothetical protein
MACSKCMRRDFGNPSWVCPEHGRQATHRQANNRYFGQPTASDPKLDARPTRRK